MKKILKLRNHIPISGPARREPTDGKETDMRVSLGFEPAWFRQRCGIDFSEKWHTDPIYRYESIKKMKEILCKNFPSVAYWDEKYKDDLATVSGCYGAYVIPKVFGFPLIYAVDRWPEIDKDKAKLTVKEIETIHLDDILSNIHVKELFQQMNIIKEYWGKIHGYLNWQGVLNNAFCIRGQDIFTDFYDRPVFVHRLFSLISDVMIQLALKVQKKQRESGFYINHFCVSNCTVNMVSPGIYREFLLPYDKKIAGHFERFGMHTCNWNVTPYLEEIKKIKKLGYLDMGIMSDMKRVRGMFPEARRAVMYSAIKLKEASLGELKGNMEKISRELSPCDIVMADIQVSTGIRRINDFLRICRDIEEKRR